MADFLLAYGNTMISEGGYSSNATDRGGETYMGISRKNFADWPGWTIIDRYDKVDISRINRLLFDNHELQMMVKDFYKASFWPALFDRLDQDVANELFDTAVNQGPGTAIKYFQQSLNLLNRNQKDYSNIPVDGGMGPLTISNYDTLIATKNYPGRSYNKVVKVLLKVMNYFQMKRYIDLTEKDESQEAFLFGWTERVI